MNRFTHHAIAAIAAVMAAGLLAVPPALAKKKSAPAPVAAQPDSATTAAPSAQDPVAVVGGTKITASQLNDLAAGRLAPLRTQEYTIKRQVLEELITKTMLENEAKTRGITLDELNKQEIDAKAPQVTDEEAKAFYDQNKARYGDKPEDEVIALIKPSLQQQKVNQRRTEFLGEVRARAGVKVLLESPRINVDPSDDPSKGPKEAPVTIVEFSDFQ